MSVPSRLKPEEHHCEHELEPSRHAESKYEAIRVHSASWIITGITTPVSSSVKTRRTCTAPYNPVRGHRAAVFVYRSRQSLKRVKKCDRLRPWLLPECHRVTPRKHWREYFEADVQRQLERTFNLLAPKEAISTRSVPEVQEAFEILSGVARTRLKVEASDTVHLNRRVESGATRPSWYPAILDQQSCTCETVQQRGVLPIGI